MSEFFDNKISFLTIFRPEDYEFADGYLSHVPHGTEIVMVQTLEDKVRQGIFNEETTDLGNGTILKTADYYYRRFSFSEALNEAKTLCTKDWIVKLDIDERIIFEPKEIEYLNKNLAPTVGGIQIPLHNYSAPPKGSKYAVCGTAQLLRIYRNLPMFKYKYSVHEQIFESIANNGYNIIVTPEVSPLIRHLGYIGTNNKVMTEKFLRNSKLLCRDILEIPNTDKSGLNWTYQYLLKTLESMEAGGMIKRLDEYGQQQ